MPPEFWAPGPVTNSRGFRHVEMMHEGANEHIDKLANKYMGQEKYPFYRPGKARIIVKIEPEHVTLSQRG